MFNETIAEATSCVESRRGQRSAGQTGQGTEGREMMRRIPSTRETIQAKPWIYQHRIFERLSGWTARFCSMLHSGPSERSWACTEQRNQAFQPSFSAPEFPAVHFLCLGAREPDVLRTS